MTGDAMTECGATVTLATGDTLTCHLSSGHGGLVHDDNGHQWGDDDLTGDDDR